jgi:hypothetical protein
VSGRGGALGLPFLGELPISLETRIAGDAGTPIAAGEGPMRSTPMPALAAHGAVVARAQHAVACHIDPIGARTSFIRVQARRPRWPDQDRAIPAVGQCGALSSSTPA